MYFVDQAKTVLLKKMLAGDDVAFDVRLIKSNTTEIPGRVWADLTEADFVGYAPWTPASYSTPTINGADEGETDGPVITFTAGLLLGAQTIYGIALTWLDTDNVTRRLCMYHKFTTPQSVAISGDTVVARIDLFTQNLVP